jgi:predicted molibdopterin-dependent oxidoreductase YjgC
MMNRSFANAFISSMNSNKLLEKYTLDYAEEVTGIAKTDLNPHC